MEILHRFMDDIKKRIGKYIKNQEYTKAIDELTERIAINQKNIDLYILRGDVHNIKQEYAKALNDYNKAVKLEPGHKIVTAKIELIKDILKFQALDIYSSTNLNKDPWLDE